uniref:Uncharacterized protein n=1 Tax=Anopheles melas TaxID=34690 RepID=A0A182U8W2_9DIPT
MRRTEKRRTASFRELRLQEQLCPVPEDASAMMLAIASDATFDTAVPLTPPSVSSDLRFEAGGVRMPSSDSMMPIGAGDASSCPMRVHDSICSILMLTKSCE